MNLSYQRGKWLREQPNGFVSCLWLTGVQRAQRCGTMEMEHCIQPARLPHVILPSTFNIIQLPTNSRHSRGRTGCQSQQPQKATSSQDVGQHSASTVDSDSVRFTRVREPRARLQSDLSMRCTSIASFLRLLQLGAATNCSSAAVKSWC